MTNLSTNGDDTSITGVNINLLRILNFTDGTKNNNKENYGYTPYITKDQNYPKVIPPSIPTLDNTVNPTYKDRVETNIPPQTKTTDPKLYTHSS